MKTKNPLTQEVHIPDQIGCTYTITSVKSLPLHMHHAYEIVFVLEGNVDFTCTSFNYHLSEGDIFIANVNELHSLHSDDGNNLILTFYFNPYDYSNTFPHLSYYWFFCDSYSAAEKNAPNLKHFQSLLFKIVHVLSDCDGHFFQKSYEIRTLASDIINFMINNYQNISFYEKSSIKKSFKSGDEIAMKRIFEIQEYIYLNFDEKISLDDISNHLNLNKYYVSRLIKSFLGLNLTDFLGLIRTEKAEIKLLSTDASIDQIAFECGFSSVPYFEKHFIKWNKMKPSEYRKTKIKEIDKDCESVILFDLSNQRVRAAENKLLITPINETRSFNDHYISIPMDSQGSPFTHPWSRCINISDITTAIQLLDKISLAECKRELKFDTVRIINIFDCISSISNKNIFFETSIVSFFNNLRHNGLNIEFYFLPSPEQTDDILSSMTTFLELILANYDTLIDFNCTFIINTIYLTQGAQTDDFLNSFQVLLKKYDINNLTVKSQMFDTELYTYNSMHLVSQIINYSINTESVSDYMNYRELFDIPSKSVNSKAAFAKNGLFGFWGEKKPIYHAWSLLSKLGDSLLLQNEGLIATKKGDDYFILIFDSESITFPPDIRLSSKLKFSINVQTTCSCSYNLIELSLDNDYNLFEKLDELRFPKKLTKKDVEYLNLYTSPKVSMSYFSPTEDNMLNINLNPYSAKLIILEKREF